MTYELTEKQQSLRIELSSAIISFKERLLSVAQYNLEEMDENMKWELFKILHNEDLNRASNTLLEFTRWET
jgi:hypothetical protein